MLEKENIYYWSDSHIGIHWIKGKADDWKPFVRNRVSEIKEKTDPNRWHHCVGKSNPADKLTRETNAKALVKDEIWIKGPLWLLEPNIPYNNLSDPIDTDLDSVEEGKRKVAVSLLTNVEPLQSLLNLHSYTNL
ncbi:integrase catalytic domain-containing protein [Trichonephila clavipes]|nr:integrase catalytic domain-containing protein [Trichonephila clavipes]